MVQLRTSRTFQLKIWEVLRRLVPRSGAMITLISLTLMSIPKQCQVLLLIKTCMIPTNTQCPTKNTNQWCNKKSSRARKLKPKRRPKRPLRRWRRTSRRKKRHRLLKLLMLIIIRVVSLMKKLRLANKLIRRLKKWSLKLIKCKVLSKSIPNRWRRWRLTPKRQRRKLRRRRQKRSKKRKRLSLRSLKSRLQSQRSLLLSPQKLLRRLRRWEHWLRSSREILMKIPTSK